MHKLHKAGNFKVAIYWGQFDADYWVLMVFVTLANRGNIYAEDKLVQVPRPSLVLGPIYEQKISL